MTLILQLSELGTYWNANWLLNTRCRILHLGFDWTGILSNFRHYLKCNEGLHTPEEVAASQVKFLEKFLKVELKLN